MSTEAPEPEYGEWTRGNAGQVGRLVTTWYESLFLPGQWIPMVSWEPHPDEAGLFGHDEDCGCASCELMERTRSQS